ncbi:MAG: YigZ family protein [Clostridium sp.]
MKDIEKISREKITVKKRFGDEDKKNIKEDYKLEVSRSIFLGYVYNIEKQEEVEEILMFFRQKYRDARHICYGYILDNIEKYDDDSEPIRTAGYPILEYLKNTNCNNTIIIVIRYFGGTLLGTGGLIRAYTKCAKLSLENSQIVRLYNSKKICMNIPYEKIGEVEYIIKKLNIELIYSEYLETVILEFNILEENYLEFLEYIYSVFSKNSKAEIHEKYFKQITEGYITKNE